MVDLITMELKTCQASTPLTLEKEVQREWCIKKKGEQNEKFDDFWLEHKGSIFDKPSKQNYKCNAGACKYTTQRIDGMVKHFRTYHRDEIWNAEEVVAKFIRRFKLTKIGFMDIGDILSKHPAN